MTIQVEMEWKAENLRNTAQYFSNTDAGNWPVGFEVQPTLIEDFETFLLNRTEFILKSHTTLQMLRERCLRPFVVYRPVWVYVTLSENTTYAADDRVTNAASGLIIREHNAISKKDNGVLASLTFNLPVLETNVLLANVTFLTKL